MLFLNRSVFTGQKLSSCINKQLMSNVSVASMKELKKRFLEVNGGNHHGLLLFCSGGTVMVCKILEHLVLTRKK